ncbi:MAG: hypothetical protein AB1730_24895 [Myxococcota bacterium]
MTTSGSTRTAAALRAKPPPGSNLLLRWSRQLHTWCGVALGLLIVVEAVTAIFLIHDEALAGWGAVQVPTAWLPARYRDKGHDARITALAARPGAPEELFAGTRQGLYRSRDGGRSFDWLAGPTAGLEVEALLFTEGHLWVGTRKSGLLRCSDGAIRCERVGGFRDVVGLNRSSAGEVLVAAHKEGAFILEPKTGKRTAISQALADAAGARNEKGDVLVTAVLEASPGGERTWLVGTRQGLFWGNDAVGYGRAPTERGGVVALASSGGRRIALFGGHEGASVLTPLWGQAEDGEWRALATPERSTGATAAGQPLMLAGGDALIATAGGELRLLELGRVPASRAQSVALGKVLADLHTGAFFGGRAWLVYDVVAVSLIGFVGTGLYLWLIPLLRRRQKRQALRELPAAAPAPVGVTGAE